MQALPATCVACNTDNPTGPSNTEPKNSTWNDFILSKTNNFSSSTTENLQEVTVLPTVSWEGKVEVLVMSHLSCVIWPCHFSSVFWEARDVSAGNAQCLPGCLSITSSPTQPEAHTPTECEDGVWSQSYSSQPWPSKRGSLNPEVFLVVWSFHEMIYFLQREIIWINICFTNFKQHINSLFVKVWSNALPELSVGSVN